MNVPSVSPRLTILPMPVHCPRPGTSPAVDGAWLCVQGGGKKRRGGQGEERKRQRVVMRSRVSRQLTQRGTGNTCLHRSGAANSKVNH